MYEINALGLEPGKIKAITTTEGPLLIIAGPGAGKTMTLVERIIYLVVERGVEPQHLFVSTFTEKAAKELITRVSNRLLELEVRVNLNEMYIGTLHSLFLRIIDSYSTKTRLQRNYRMLDDFDQKYLVYDNLDRFANIENTANTIGEKQSKAWSRAESIVRYVNKLHEEMLTPDALISSENGEIAALGKVLGIYNQLLEEENCLDFSTIQNVVLTLLEEYPEVTEELKAMFKYIMVDEYQDTNSIQERILFKLLNKSKNICVVGDDDQGLYRFRGATIRNILEFADNFEAGECTEVTLSTNYRSHPGIIDFYNSWMQELDWTAGNKTYRFNKTITPRNESFPEYPSVITASKDGDPEEWYKEVYDFLVHLKEKGDLRDYNQAAFLCKSVKNDRIVGLARYLENSGIPVFSPRSALFFERDEIKLMIGIFIFIFPDIFDRLKWNDSAELGVWDYYQQCKLFFAETVRSDKETYAGLLRWCNEKAKVHLALNEGSIQTDYGFAALFYEILQFQPFKGYLETDLNSSASSLRAVYNLALFSKLLNKVEYLRNITVITSKYYTKTLRDVFNRFFRFLIDGGIEEYEDFNEYAPRGCVSFMTIHQSKGLEFPVVMVDSLNLVPRKQYTEIDSILEAEYYKRGPYEPLEETKNYDFWRLFYTAFSRPQDLLVLTGNENRSGRGLGKLPSKYFDPLYDTLPRWRECSDQLSAVKLHTVKPVNIKNEYSFTSDILLYENCPLQYRFFRELDFAPVRSSGMLFGILVHQTIEDVHKAALAGEESRISGEQIARWFESNYSSLAKQLRSYLGKGQREAALKHVENYAQRHKDEWHLLKEAEVDVSLVKEDYILKGVIDLVRGENDTVEIIDFKSERIKPDVNDPEERETLSRYRRQLEIYSHIVEERTGYRVSKMHLYYTGEETGSPYISYNRESDSINETISAFDAVVNRIESKDFDNSVVKKCKRLCGNCDMRFYCEFV